MVGVVTGSVAAGLAVGSLAVGAYGVYEQSKTANKQLDMQNSQLGLEKDLYGQQQPYRDQLNKLLADPSSVKNLPGYQFNLQQGEESVARQFAANPGGGGSAALMKFGEDYASGAYQQQAELLAQLSGLTQNPAAYGSNAVGAGGNAVQAGGQNFNQLMQLLAQGGATAKLFGPGGSLSSAGTPANMGSSAGGPGGLPMTGWQPS